MKRRFLFLACGVFFIVVFGTPVANAQNLLMNQEIDVEIRPWEVAVGTAEWNSFDYLGAGDSGSILAITGDVGASLVSECVSILPEENYELSGEFWVASPQTGGILLQAIWYDDPMCTNFVAVTGSNNHIFAFDAWFLKSVASISPSEAKSVEIVIRVFSTTGSPISVYGDHFVFEGEPGPRIFADDLESGNMLHWSSVVPRHTVFISSSRIWADFGGLSAADSFCQTLASAAGLGGLWKALISNSSTSVQDRVEISGPVFSMTGAPIATDAAGFWTGTAINTPDMSELGLPPADTIAWVGSATDHCQNWTTTSSSENGRHAPTTDPDGWLYGNSIGPCHLQRSLLCISQ
jgi:hypothetical protein